MGRHRLPLVAAGIAVVVSSCAATAGVRTQRADEIVTASGDPTFVPVPTSVPDPATTDPGASDPDPEPDPTLPATTVPLDFEPDAIDFGPAKPDREYDEFLLASLTDLERWWEAEYPAVYGEAFEPLAGNVYAAYPSRPDDIPGCGTPGTTYDDVREFVAFYCGLGDFMVYDDGSDGLLSELAANFGPATIGIVLAHEYGHAIQQRSGALDQNLATVTTEQQADCFAGAWAGRAARGEAPGISFTDGDVRAGLIAMIRVEDPLGVNQFTPGGHGSGFDRVGAFQVGFQEGPSRCADLLDNPLPLTPNQFLDTEDLRNQGDAPFGFLENELLGFLTEDLDLYWDVELATTLPQFDGLTLVPVASVDAIQCDALSGRFEFGAAVCVSTSTVYLNEPEARELYGEIGDFSVGYLVGIAWADAVQTSLGSSRSGEARELYNDCLTGAWVKTVTPGAGGVLPQPRPEERQVSVSPGDLTEAIQTAILIGDVGSDDDVLGSAFEKIDAFRLGALGGLEACGL